MKKLEEKLAALLKYLPESETLCEGVSFASVGWHLEHSYLAVMVICDALMESNPEKYRWRVNFKRFFVLKTGFIPRGKGKAPDVVKPFDFTKDGIQSAYEKALESLKRVEDAPARAYIVHPIFGKLRKSSALRFVMIHTHHHENIIKDIIKQKRKD